MSSEGPFRDRDEPDFRLIETLRRDPDGGFPRLRGHLDRLVRSAEALGFGVEPEVVEDMLQHIPPLAKPLRIRIVLSPGGDVELECEQFAPLPPDAVWRLAIAGTALSSADALLRHKTTRRALYEAARAEVSRDEAEEVLLLNERGEVCEGTITNVFADIGDGGPLRTPALACGLLAGVLRAEMLAEGRAIEAVLTPEELRAARRLFVGNSLRGLIAATLLR